MLSKISASAVKKNNIGRPLNHTNCLVFILGVDLLGGKGLSTQESSNLADTLTQRDLQYTEYSGVIQG